MTTVRNLTYNLKTEHFTLELQDQVSPTGWTKMLMTMDQIRNLGPSVVKQATWAREAAERMIQTDGARVGVTREFSIPMAVMAEAEGMTIQDVVMRGMMLAMDRAVEKFDGAPTVAMLPGHRISLKFSCPTAKLDQVENFMGSLEQELVALPTLGAAWCPCGCRSDLAVRSCRRQEAKVADNKGLEITPPAFRIRNEVHPDHADHGILGWAGDEKPGDERVAYAISNILLACTCGQVLGIPVQRWTIPDNGNVGPAMKFGPASEVIREAVKEHFERKEAAAQVRAVSAAVDERRVIERQVAKTSVFPYGSNYQQLWEDREEQRQREQVYGMDKIKIAISPMIVNHGDQEDE